MALKTLENLGDLYVHYAYCDDVAARERGMLEAFAEGLSEETCDVLHDAAQVMPFANLEDGQGRRKAHGIRGARAPRVLRQQEGTSHAGLRRAEPIDAGRVASTPTKQAALSAHQTQRITAGDIKRGILRIPNASKALFPPERAQVEIELRGARESCRWDPRHGPDRERSGVLGVGIALAGERVAEGERLGIRVEGGVFFLA